MVCLLDAHMEGVVKAAVCLATLTYSVTLQYCMQFRPEFFDLKVEVTNERTYRQMSTLHSGNFTPHLVLLLHFTFYFILPQPADLLLHVFFHFHMRFIALITFLKLNSFLMMEAVLPFLWRNFRYFCLVAPHPVLTRIISQIFN